jgi:hypothetical protein
VTGPATHAAAQHVEGPAVAPAAAPEADKRRRLWTIVLIAALLLCFGAVAYALGASSASDSNDRVGSDETGGAAGVTEEDPDPNEKKRERTDRGADEERKRAEDERKGAEEARKHAEEARKRAKESAKERRKRGRGKE